MTMNKTLLAAVMAVGATLAGLGDARAATFATLNGAAPIIIAHRGASGYLPEHTLAGYELAAKMGVDYIEPDLQFTKDGELVAIHDTTLTRTTDVADKFAQRDGDYRVADFTLAEIKTLTVKPTGTAATTYPGFTPSAAEPFAVPTFAEVLAFVNAFNAAEGTDIGVYPEAKSPTSTAMNRRIVEQLKAAGFAAPTDKAFIQSFSFPALQDIAAIQSELGTDLAQVALGAAVIDGDGLFGLSDFGANPFVALSDITAFASGVGVWTGSPALSSAFVAAAHDLGLVVHGWTFRKPDEAAAAAEFQTFIDMGLDGFFANYPDQGLRAVAAQTSPVPLPAPVALLALGLVALVGAGRRRA